MVIADQAKGTLAGHVIRYWISRETHWAAMGIDIFDPAEWGCGFGHEALGLWIDHLFCEEPRLVRLGLRTWSGNIRMMRLAERLGFRLEARFRDARSVEGEFHDAIGYGLLRAEWNALHPGGLRS